MCVYLLDKQGRPRKGDVSRILKLRPHIKLRPKEIAPIRWAGVSIGAMAGGLFRLGSDGWSDGVVCVALEFKPGQPQQVNAPLQIVAHTPCCRVAVAMLACQRKSFHFCGS